MLSLKNRDKNVKIRNVTPYCAKICAFYFLSNFAQIIPNGMLCSALKCVPVHFLIHNVFNMVNMTNPKFSNETVSN